MCLPPWRGKKWLPYSTYRVEELVIKPPVLHNNINNNYYVCPRFQTPGPWNGTESFDTRVEARVGLGDMA